MVKRLASLALALVLSLCFSANVFATYVGETKVYDLADKVGTISDFKPVSVKYRVLNCNGKISTIDYTAISPYSRVSFLSGTANQYFEGHAGDQIRFQFDLSEDYLGKVQAGLLLSTGEPIVYDLTAFLGKMYFDITLQRDVYFQPFIDNLTDSTIYVENAILEIS